MQAPKGYILLKKGEFEELMADYRALLARVSELEKQIRKNSENSHKPPSSDGFKKKPVKNNRTFTGRKQGGQYGHKGSTLEMVAIPDKINVHKVEGKCDCGRLLENALNKGYQRRQVTDLVEKLTEVIEHQIEIKECLCGKTHYGEQDKYIAAQYGTKIRALTTYLNQYQFLPFDRTQEICKDLFGIRIGDGCIQASNERCFANLQETENKIKQKIKSTSVINQDETGMRCEGHLQWVHTSSTNQLTHFTIHSNRGIEAIEDIGILPNYGGTIVHDRLRAYDSYVNCEHGYCNGHLLRDLKYIHEEDKKPWAGKMISVLMTAKKFKDNDELDKNNLEHITRIYNRALKIGFDAEPPPTEKPTGQRGQQKKSKSLLLLEVFQNKREAVLRFINDPLVPFDNNLAERDLRMVKLKQKVSGTFRTKKGGEIFCRIRGYISTSRKLGHNVMEAIRLAITGNPLDFVNI